VGKTHDGVQKLEKFRDKHAFNNTIIAALLSTIQKKNPANDKTSGFKIEKTGR